MQCKDFSEITFATEEEGFPGPGAPYVEGTEDVVTGTGIPDTALFLRMREIHKEDADIDFAAFGAMDIPQDDPWVFR